MMAVDTNVLVRMLIDDPGQPEQVESARRLALEAGQVFVAQIVQVELVWVLESAYQLKKTEVIFALEQLLHNEAFCLQEEASFMRALSFFRENSAGFSACLIATEGGRSSDGLLTFDKKLARLEGVRLVR